MKFAALISFIVIAALLCAAPIRAVEIDDLVDSMDSDVDAIGDLSFPSADHATSFPTNIEDLEDMAADMDLENLDVPSDVEIDSISNEIDSLDNELDSMTNNDVQTSEEWKRFKKMFKKVNKCNR